MLGAAPPFGKSGAGGAFRIIYGDVLVVRHMFGFHSVRTPPIWLPFRLSAFAATAHILYTSFEADPEGQPSRRFSETE